MKRNYVRNFLFIAVVSVVLAGCSGKTKYDFDTSKSLVYVESEDSIISIVVEKFDKKKYSEKELEKAINEEINEYNESADESDGMSLINFDIKKSVATMELKFKSPADYSAYHTQYVYFGTQITMLVGSIEELTGQEISFEGDFNEIGKDDKTTVTTLDDIKDKEDLKVIVINEGTDIRVKGTIMYTSLNVEVKEGLATTTSGENNYIIYK